MEIETEREAGRKRQCGIDMRERERQRWTDTKRADRGVEKEEKARGEKRERD